MPRITFTPHLQRHLDCPPREVSGRTVREALEAAFQHQQTLRGYVLDDQGCLRQHMVIFIDGRPITDRRMLSDGVEYGSDIYVMQALSGG